MDSNAVRSTDSKEEEIPDDEKIGTKEVDILGTNDRIKIRVIDGDNIRISNNFNVSITDGELNGNPDSKENVEDEGNVISKVDSTKDRK